MATTTRTGIITKCVFNREFKTPKYGTIWYFNLEFDNGDAGEMSTTKVDVIDGKIYQKKFQLDKEVEYTIEAKTNSRGTNYNKIDKPKSDQPYTGARKPDPQRKKRIVKSVSIDCAINYKIYSGSDVLINTLAPAFVEWVYSKGEDEGLSIAAQASLKMAVNSIRTIDIPEERDAISIEWVLERANNFYNYIIS